ncbi:hypothetical protein [Chryseobacterium salipaludis]|uniref:hypothetical protein n=1 Tax=Planobacterium sp. JC490 TaxID=2994550 RepID=UPI00225B2704|nr:hypothetical protein [Planobacterium sp. JC490]MCX3295827.1 hypothetical protein [Planobacterium sp. JC490]
MFFIYIYRKLQIYSFLREKYLLFSGMNCERDRSGYPTATPGKAGRGVGAKSAVPAQGWQALLRDSPKKNDLYSTKLQRSPNIKKK